jgi:hypothetical protein
MASVSAIRDGLRARLATISGLRAYARLQGDIEVPGAVVVPSGGTYDSTMGRGSDDMVFEVRLAVSRADDRTAQELLDQYLAGAGAKSVKAAIEADKTLGGVVDFARVAGWDDYGDVTVAGVQYFGTTLTVEVTASGT